MALVSSKSVYGYENVVVVIDPGHGGPVEEGADETNSGAQYHDLNEKDINLITALAFKEELEQYSNVSVYMTRDEDVYMSLDDRVNYAQSVNADVLISVHYNASADHNFFGSEIFTSAFGESFGVGNGLAQYIMKEWVSYGNLEKAIKTRIGNSGKDYYGLIRNGRDKNIPTIILEHGYIDNDRDFLRLNNELAWKQMGIADATGVANFYGLRKDTVKESVAPVTDIVIPDNPVMPDDTQPRDVRLEINNYDSHSGDIDFTLYAYDDESKLMYYGFLLKDASEDDVFAQLELWEGKNGKMTGTYHVRPGYSGPITAAVFNVYQLHGISPAVALEADDDMDDESDNMDEMSDESEAEAESVSEDEAESDLLEAKSEMDSEGSEENALKIELGLKDEKPVVTIDFDSKDSKVQDAYNKFMIVGLIFSIIIVVLIIVCVYSIAQKNKHRRRDRYKTERKSYDWIDDDD